MNHPANGRVTAGRMTLALALANLRYWLTVSRRVRRELQRWQRHAHAIPDRLLRAHALGKLADAGAHAQITATLATLAPLRRRARVVTAIVAFEVIYDYLDAVSEQPVPDPLRNGRQLYRALGLALGGEDPQTDPYRHHPQCDDGGYLDALVATCRAAFLTLPAAAAVAPVAWRTAACCGEAQTRSHAVAREGTGQLMRWAARVGSGSGLTASEVAAGFAASVLTVHALIAAAADVRTTLEEARRIAVAYLPVCALTTLLDSLLDRTQDAVSGDHSYLGYYVDDSVAAERLCVVAGRALAGAGALRHAAHHAMAVSGTAAYYLSTWRAGSAETPLAAQRVTHELRPVITPILLLFRTWRLQRQRSADRRSARVAAALYWKTAVCAGSAALNLPLMKPLAGHLSESSSLFLNLTDSRTDSEPNE